MAYDLKTLGQYGYVPVGSLEDMTKEAVLQLAAVGKTRQEIADVLGVTYSTISRYVTKYDVPVRRKEYGSKLSDRTVQEFEKLVAAGLTMPEIAGVWDVDVKAVYNWAHDRNVKAERRKAILRAAKAGAL